MAMRPEIISLQIVPMRVMMDWERELVWLYTRLKGKSLIVFILKLAWNSYIYHIWEERNCRKFRNTYRDCSSLLGCIKDTVCIRVCSRRVHMDDVNRHICAAWGIL
ncbi:hypothetical protein GQ457_06G041750 [Hibiscus cannabinus]